MRSFRFCVIQNMISETGLKRTKAFLNKCIPTCFLTSFSKNLTTVSHYVIEHRKKLVISLQTISFDHEQNLTNSLRLQILVLKRQHKIVFVQKDKFMMKRNKLKET